MTKRKDQLLTRLDHIRFMRENFPDAEFLPKDEILIWCIESNCTGKKPHLQINFSVGVFRCWRCDYKGSVRRFLYDYLGTESAPELYRKLAPWLSKTGLPRPSIPVAPSRPIDGLPESFQPLPEESGFLGRRATDYLRKRGVTDVTMKRFGLGYCFKGRYSECVVFPCFTEQGKLEYFTARSFLENRKLNPDTERAGVLFNVSMAYRKPTVIVCEGPMSAVVATQNLNDPQIVAVALLGKTATGIQRDRILGMGTKDIVVMLDPDAGEHSLALCRDLCGRGIPVWEAKLLRADPADSTYDELNAAYTNRVPVDFRTAVLRTLA